MKSNTDVIGRGHFRCVPQLCEEGRVTIGRKADHLWSRPISLLKENVASTFKSVAKLLFHGNERVRKLGLGGGGPFQQAPKFALAVILTGALSVLPACEKKSESVNEGAAAMASEKKAALPPNLFVSTEPTGAKTVEEAKSTARQGDAVVIRGRIGGSVAPFVENRAVFTIMGTGLKACSDNPADKCKTPWDYCCDTPEDIAKHSATIQVVDSSGSTLRTGLRGVSGLKELSEVVVVGKIAQTAEKVLVIHATNLFLARP